MRRLVPFSLALVACLLPAVSAFAHPGHEGDVVYTNAFAAGLLHPLFGIDHLLAMVAVGLLAARAGGRAMGLLPVAFLAAMSLGGALSAGSVYIPWVEYGIAASVAAFGLLLALAGKAPLRIAAPIVAGFAVLHGWAHLAELPVAASATEYAAGFLLSTAALHAAGIGIGLALRGPAQERSFHFAGAGIAAASVLILAGWL